MKISASKRELTGKKVKNIRKEGSVPGSVYGPNKASENIQVDKKELIKLFKQVGYNQFFDLEITGEKPAKVLIKYIQVHPVSYEIKSVSFYQVDEHRKITVEVPVKFVGDSPAIKQNLGFLIEQLDTVAVHCLPKDLSTEILVDISTLEKPGDAITVGQLKLGENVELDSSMDPTTAIVYIGTAQKEEVEAPVATEATAEGAEGTAGTTSAAAPAAPAAEDKKAKK